jgi:hypothetical protein
VRPTRSEGKKSEWQKGQKEEQYAKEMNEGKNEETPKKMDK